MWRFYTLYEQRYSNLRPLLPLVFPKDSENLKKVWHLTLGIGGKNTFKWSEQMKKKKFVKNFFCPLWSKVFKSETTSFHYFSGTDHVTSGPMRGLIENFNWWGWKTDKQINKQTKKQTNMATLWLNRPSGAQSVKMNTVTAGVMT